MTKKVCFVLGVGERYRLLYRVAQEMMRRYSIEPVYLAVHSAMVDYLLKHGVRDDQIVTISDNIRFGVWKEAAVDYDFLNKVERDYGIPNLYLYWEGIRTYEGYTHYDELKVLETVFKWILSFVEEHQFDFALMDTFPASLPMMALSAIMDKRGTPFYFLISSRIRERFLIVKGMRDVYDRVDNIFDSLKNRDLTPEERKAAEEVVARYHSDKRYLSTSEKAVFEKKDLELTNFRRAFGSLYESFKYKTYGGYRKGAWWSPVLYFINKLKTMVNKQVLLRNRLFKNPISEDKFVLFLLHKQPEATTFVKSPFFMDQRYLIEIVAKSLPVGYSVYVKPHHNDFGNKPITYFKEMASRPNVRLLKTYCNSQELVRKSAAVVTISGTVGWEGIILGKPVITFGNVFYNAYDQVMHVSDITQLPDLLRKAIFQYTFDRELMLKYVFSHIKGTYNGIPLSPVYTKDRSLEPENISNLVNGIQKEFGL